MRSLDEFITKKDLLDLLDRALTEDLGSGDATTLSLVPEEKTASAIVVAKEKGVLAGVSVFQETMFLLDKNLNCSILKKDGEEVAPGDEVLRFSGSARALLSGERTAMNFLGLMSGIASASSRFASLTENKKLTVIDTRKTTPLLRALEKYAVQAGGCGNHRTGLYDMILIKENHLRAAGSITVAVERARAAYPSLKIEVETTDFNEIKEAVDAGADRVMFDNMDDDMIQKALKITDGRCETEASGNMNEERIASLANSGLDYISVGSLTHSISCLDLSMLMNEQK